MLSERDESGWLMGGDDVKPVESNFTEPEARLDRIVVGLGGELSSLESCLLNPSSSNSELLSEEVRISSAGAL